MTKIFVWFAITSLLTAETQCIIPSKINFEKAKTDLAKLIESNRVNNDLPFIAGFVRLAFHDCIGSGGCDGCIDHSNPDNAGLKRYTDPLDLLYNQSHVGKISRADFYALAAVVALSRSTLDTFNKYTGFDLFRVGRKDCSLSPAEDSDASFPKGTDGETKTFQFFKDFGFNEREAVILLGAHTLGRSTLSNSGYHGPWVDNRFSKPNPLAPTSVLDNSYYNMIVKIPPWKQFKTTANKMQWQEPSSKTVNDPSKSNTVPILLNSDMAIFYNLESTDSIGSSSCTLPRPLLPTLPACNSSVGRAFAQQYANNNGQWIKDFTGVFNRMIEKNSEALVPTSILTNPKNDLKAKEVGNEIHTFKEKHDINKIHDINVAVNEITKLLDEISDQIEG